MRWNSNGIDPLPRAMREPVNPLPRAMREPADLDGFGDARSDVHWMNPDPAPRPRCLLAARHGHFDLLAALRGVIGRELREFEFVLEADGPVECVWICGYEPGGAELVAALRRHHPHATILVTRFARGHDWEGEVLAAGADVARRWPLPIEELRELLSRRAKRPAS